MKTYMLLVLAILMTAGILRPQADPDVFVRMPVHAQTGAALVTAPCDAAQVPTKPMLGRRASSFLATKHGEETLPPLVAL